MTLSEWSKQGGKSISSQEIWHAYSDSSVLPEASDVDGRSYSDDHLVAISSVHGRLAWQDGGREVVSERHVVLLMGIPRIPDYCVLHTLRRTDGLGWS